MSGNNSYGRYGVVSKGFDTTETTIDGTVYGNQLAYTAISLTGAFAVDGTITGSSSGAVGTITNVQTGANKLYYKITSGTFTVGETITGSNGATAVIAADGVTGQKGFVLVLTGLASEPKVGGSIEFTTGDTGAYVIQSVSGTYANSSSKLVIVLAGEKVTPSTDGTAFKIRYAFSQARLTGHDFLSIGTGNSTQTNYPGIPSIPPSQANEVIETFPGRVFYVSTDQDGNFRVGDYFRVDQATGRATLNANAFDLSGLTSLRLGSIGAQLGELVSEFSSDDTLSGNSNSAVPTEAAVRNYLPQVATNIIPNTDNTRDLGSPSKRWAHVYVGPGSVTIGSLTLTDNSGAFTVSSTGATPPTLSVPEINTGSIRYFQNNIIGGNSNEDIIIDTSGTGKLQVLADLNMTGTLSGPATFNIDPAAVGDNTGTVVIKGNLQVDGTTTTVNSTTMTVDDKNIVLGSGAANDAAADGSGITVESGEGNKTLNWVDATDAWTSSEDFNLLTGKKYEINGTEVLSSSKLTLNGSSSGTVAFQAAAAAGSVTYTLPSADAAVSGYALVSNASGTLSWAAAGATISDDSSTTTLYPTMSTTTSGSLTTAKISSTKFTFNASTGGLTVTGPISANNLFNYQLTRTVPTTVNNTVNIGTFSTVGSASASAMRFTVTVGASGFSQAKQYFITQQFGVQAGAGTWYTLLPFSTTGSYSGNDFDVEVQNNNGSQTVSLRLRRTGGTDAGNATIHIDESNGVTFTPSTSTDTSVAAVTGISYHNTLVQNTNNGRVGIGTQTPGSLFHIQDNSSYLQQFQMYQSNAPVSGFGQSMSMDAYTGNGAGGASQYMAGVSFGAYSAATGANTGIISFHTAISGTKATRFTIDNSGNGVFAGTMTSNSDATLKTNVATITTALDKVVALRGVMFDRISTGVREMGVIAQEVEQVVPEIVFTDENGIKSVAYANTVALLIEAIKEQQIQINELKGKQ